MVQRLPRAIQAQVEAADALMKAPDQPVVPDEQAGQQPTPEPAPAPADEQPAQPPAAPAEAPVEDFKQKYKVLQGMYNSQVPALQRDNAKLTERVNELTRAIEELRQKPAPAAVAPAPAVPAEDTKKDSDEFGRDLVEMVQRQVRAYTAHITTRFAAFEADVTKRIEALEGGVQQVVKTATLTAEESFYDRLAREVPDWEAINATDEFKLWLAEVDPVYGVERQKALDRHHANLDVTRTAAVFKAFKALTPAKPAPAPMKQVLQQQVSPSGTGSAAAPTPPQKETFTAQQVELFYREVAQNKWVGREKEAAAMEARINAALAEGRIR